MHPIDKANFVSNAGVDVLICGAVSRALEQILRSAGIEVYSYVAGEVEGVIRAYLNGELWQERFILPGCRRSGGPGRMRRRHGRRAGHDYRTSIEEEK